MHQVQCDPYMEIEGRHTWFEWSSTPLYGNGIGTAMPCFSKAPAHTPVPSSLKTQMTNELVKMCTMDIRPFKIVDGEGFKAVAQKLLSIKVQYGNVPVNDVLPCATTVSRHLKLVVTTQRQALRDRLSSAVNVGITTDSWTHLLTNDHYITTAVHYIDGEWNVNFHILATQKTDEKQTADYVKNFVDDILQEFGVLKDGNVFTTDNAANMKAVFREESWLPRAGHNLNLVLLHALQAGQGLDVEDATLTATTKELVTLAKRSSLNRLM